MNRPNSVLFLTSPSTSVPAGWLCANDLPRVLQGLLEAQRDAALVRIDFEHDHFDFLGGRNDLAGVHVLLGPAHFGHVDQAFNAWLQLNKGTVVGDVGDATGELGLDWVLGFDAFPWISLKLLHAERDAVGFLVDADDLDLDGLADGQDFGRVVDAAPCDVGDVQQAVDAAQVNERTVIGDVLDDAFDHLALFELLDDFRTLFSARFFENGTARNDDIAAALVHLEDLEGLRHIHQRRDVADRTDIDLRTRQEGHGAFEINGEATLDLVEDGAFNALIGVVLLFELDPALFAASLFAAQNGFAERVFDALDVNFDFVADLQRAVLGLRAEFLQSDAAFDLEADVNDSDVLLDGRNNTLGDVAFGKILGRKGFLQQRGKIVAGGVSLRHEYS